MEFEQDMSVAQNSLSYDVKNTSIGIAEPMKSSLRFAYIRN